MVKKSRRFDGEWEASCSCGDHDTGTHGEMHDWGEEHMAMHDALDPDDLNHRVTVKKRTKHDAE